MMEVKPVEIYSEVSNQGIVRMPGREYPGCVIQGDSLAILFRTARRVAEALKTAAIDDGEVLGDLEDLCRSLLDRLLHYQEVLHQEGFDLPYVRPFSKDDAIRLMPEEDDGEEPQP
jgi:hypothetical protein